MSSKQIAYRYWNSHKSLRRQLLRTNPYKWGSPMWRKFIDEFIEKLN